MTTRELSAILGRSVVLYDQRTGMRYDAHVIDAREVYGTLHLSVVPGVWFVPTAHEATSLKLTEGAARG